MRLAHFNAAQNSDREAMEALLSERLEALTWPYETIVAFDVIDSKTVALDVDLPEFEDLPVKECSVAARRNKLNVKVLSEKRKRLLYLEHIHAIEFRLVGEAFATLPTVETCSRPPIRSALTPAP